MASKRAIKRYLGSQKLGAIATVLLWTTPLLGWGLIRPVSAQTAAGTIIENTATGSFLDTSNNQTKEIFSNTVAVQVVEVAGVTITFDSAVEANSSQAGTNAGAFQGDGTINSEDLVYYRFIITNVGNDPTEFVLPTLPSFVTTGATFAGPIQVIAYDPDGASGAIAATDLTTSPNNPINVQAADGNGDLTPSTSTTDLLGTTNGYIPPQGTVTVWVPVKMSTNPADVGTAINVVLGNTGANDNSAGTQNQVIGTDPDGNDVITKDLADGFTRAGFPNETAGLPVSEKEASALGSVSLGAAYALKGYKSVKLTTAQNSSTPINEGNTVDWTIFYVNTGTGNITNIQITDDLASKGITYVAASLAVETGNTTTFPTNLVSGTQPTLNSSYDGDTLTGAATDDEFFSGTLPTLAPGEILKITFQTTIQDKTPDNRTETNQATATGDNTATTPSAIAPVNTDNIDNTTAGLPSNVTVPASSVVQTQNTGTIDPTALNVVSPSATFDYGDAPDSYKTLGASGGAVHTLLANPDSLKIGATAPDSEADGVPTANADGDDVTGDDEDNLTFPVLQTNTTTYTLNVPVTNSTGSAATLAAWIDFDRDGSFQADEGTTIAVPDSTAGNVTLTWNDIGGTTGPNIVAGQTYARFRLTTAPVTTASFIGSLSDGEVEDHPLTIASPSSPELLLVKRITALIPGDGSPVQTFTTFNDDGILNNADNNSKWLGYNNGSNGYTVGITSTGASPGDIVEYTIYFLNAGDAEATNVTICDRLSPYLTYVNNTYGASPNTGIRLVFGNDSDIKNLTEIKDSDLGELVTAGVDLTGTCKSVNDNNTPLNPNDDFLEDLGSSQNVNGVVVVNATGGTSPTQIDAATGAGTPTTSFGYIRFRAVVK